MLDAPILLLFAVVGIAAGYVAQVVSAVYRRDSPPQQEGKLWRTVAMIFVVPMLVSVIVAISDNMLLPVPPEQIVPLERVGFLSLDPSNIEGLLTIIQSVLLIFISLELSHVTLGTMPQKWRDLLLIALVLDVAALVIVYAVKSMDYQAYELPIALGLLSVFSSFVIVLMAREYVEAKLEIVS